MKDSTEVAKDTDSMNNFYDEIFKHQIVNPVRPVSIVKGKQNTRDQVKFRENFKKNRFMKFKQ